MSYCRFSSANWKSDVYVYEDVSGGWTTHVAGRRRTWPVIPDLSILLMPRFGAEWSAENRRVVYPSRWHALGGKIFGTIWCWWHRLHMWTVGISPLKEIGLAHDGGTFNDATPGECADRLLMLRALGYCVPQYAVDELRDEHAEATPPSQVDTPAKDDMR